MQENEGDGVFDPSNWENCIALYTDGEIVGAADGGAHQEFLFVVLTLRHLLDVPVELLCRLLDIEVGVHGRDPNQGLNTGTISI